MIHRGMMRTVSIMLVLFMGLAYGQPNTPPVIDITYSDIFSVGEDETATRVVFYFTVNDAENDWFTCEIKDIKDLHGNDNDGDEFIVTNTSRTAWRFEIAPGATFTHPEIYEMELECDDGDDKSDKIKFHAHVVPGQDIKWDYGGTQANINGVDASTTKAGDTVSTIIKVDDTLNHEFDYILTGQNFAGNDALAGPNGPYWIYDIATGDLIPIQDLEHIPADNSRSNLNHYAQDKQLKIWGSARVRFTNQNERPQTDTLPLTQTQPESITPADVLWTMNTVDTAYAGQTIKAKMNCNPPEWEGIFELDAGFNFRLRAGKRVDYENGNRDFTCTFILNDGLHDGDPETYTCSITDVNEAPIIGADMYYVTIDEGPTGGTSVDSRLVCKDEDSANGPEPLTLTVTSDTCNGMFDIDNAGMVSRVKDVDVDASGTITSCEMDVRCADDDGLSDTTKIAVTISDINDNDPVIASPITMTSYTTMVDGETVIGKLTPTDPDLKVPNNQHVCDSYTSTSTFAACYEMASNCDVVANCNGTAIPVNELTSFDVTITDKGTPARTTTTTLNIRHQEVFTSPTTVTIAITTQDEWLFHPENIALLALASLFGLILLSLLGFCCLRYCWGRNLCCRCLNSIRGWCKRRPKQRPVTPVTPPRRRTPPPRPKSPRIIREPAPDPVIVRVIARPKPTLIRTLY